MKNPLKRKYFKFRENFSRLLLVSYEHIKFIYNDYEKRQKIFGLQSPLTNEWIEFTVSDQYLASNTLSKAAMAVEEYYNSMFRTLSHARDFQPLNHDLTAWNTDECRLFGVVDPRPKKRNNFLDLYGDVY